MPLSDGDTASGAYSRADRLLHRIALGSAPVLEMSFDIERSRFGRAARARAAGGAPVFVAGLARAGTTIVTRMLHDSGVFASLTYRDMPFPLAPNSWHGMTRAMKPHASEKSRNAKRRTIASRPSAICHSGSFADSPARSASVSLATIVVSSLGLAA